MAKAIVFQPFVIPSQPARWFAMTCKHNGFLSLLSDGFGILRRGDAELFLKLPGEMMHGGILQHLGDLRKVQVVFPDQLLALLELDAADVLTGGDLQILVEERSQVAGAHIHLPGHHRNRQFLPDVGRDILLGLADDGVFIVDGVEMADISYLNPRDVKSVEVLKDSSSSIYGIRGAYGVIIITTRR